MELPALALAFGVAWTPVAVPAPKAVPLGPVRFALSAPAVFDAAGAPRTWDEALADLATARVVAVGESHDDAAHHQIQAEVLAALAARAPRLAVAFEMVGCEDQGTLDAFMSGALPEADFAVWWKKNWGYDFALYKPIFDAAKAANIPAYGLNAPIALVRAVSKGGLSSLTPADRARLPVSIRESDDLRYRAYVNEAVSGHGPLTPDQLKNRLEAMAVWNETMGEKAALLAAGGRTVLVIAGEGHVLYKAGILESAARRGAGPVKSLLPWSAAPEAAELGLADWFRVAP
ncbi:MAG: ChaN family lipoprotein [Elusimicrobia bacterium]|nr:ChaN family lipoprotein [Elusimicrobiota bacterium]